MPKFFAFSIFLLFAFSATNAQAAKAKSIPAVMKDITPAYLNAGTEHFNEQIALVSKAEDCFPVHVSQHGRTGVFYLHCSPEALALDVKGEELTDKIHVPDALARRYHFWRRVYSLWSKDQYVLHVGNWPEVVLEVADITRVDTMIPERAREKIAKRLLDDHRRDYAKLLVRMYQERNKDQSHWSPTMKRLAGLMDHIKAEDKYLVAANSLRVQRGQRDFIAKGLAMSARYLPAIEREFEAEGVPVELSRIAFVESSFNLAAESRVGASGVYQLMEITARQWVHVSEMIDERNDPVKAARVAARVLSQYYRILGSWPLAITAYNHGVNGIKNATRSAKTVDLPTLIETHRGNAFGFASKNFFTEYCAMLKTLQKSRSLFPEVESMPALAFETIRMNKPTPVSEIRKKYKMTSEDFAFMNRDISRRFVRMDGTLPRGYRVKVPTQEIPASADGLTLTAGSKAPPVAKIIPASTKPAATKVLPATIRLQKKAKSKN